MRSSILELFVSVPDTKAKSALKGTFAEICQKVIMPNTNRRYTSWVNDYKITSNVILYPQHYLKYKNIWRMGKTVWKFQTAELSDLQDR